MKLLSEKEIYIAAKDDFILQAHQNGLAKFEHWDIASCDTKSPHIENHKNHKDSIEISACFRNPNKPNRVIKFCEDCLKAAHILTENLELFELSNCFYCEQEKDCFPFNFKKPDFVLCKDCISTGLQMIKPMISISDAFSAAFIEIYELKKQIELIGKRKS